MTDEGDARKERVHSEVRSEAVPIMTWLAITAGGLALIALLLQLAQARQRLARLPLLAPAAAPALPALPPPHDIRILAAPSVRLDGAAVGAAAAHMQAHQLEALDLMPADLDVGTAIEIASLADPAALGADPFARAAGAGYAVVVRSDLLSRAGIATPEDRPSVAAAAERLRRFAAGRTGAAILPGLRVVPEPAAERAAMLRARTGANMGPVLYVQGIRWGLLALALIADWRIGLVVLLLASVLPSLLLAGLPIRPRDRWRSLAARVPRDLAAWGRALLQRDRGAAIDAERSDYARLLADGTAPFFMPRRQRCPVCGEAGIAPHVSLPDQLQRKPGRFTLDRCAACRVIFQNPALSPRGLDFYYRDFYDGFNADIADDLFSSTHTLYASRVTSVMAAGARPARWLDVGCGYAHFSLAARRQLPATRFEGLDRSRSVEDAARRGWIDRAWRQSLEELAHTGERFDVVSLFHYLEHTQDPAADLRAAARLLTPGGRLILEIPNPRCRLGSILGRWWFPWFQPQHQFLLHEAAVSRMLAAARLEPVSVTYLMTAGDVLLAALLMLRCACSAGDVPWAPPPGMGRRLADAVIWAAGLPLLTGALFLDLVYAALPASPSTSNALRVVAAPQRA
jgi:ubiquinone/menaquinone biosynthesis C-methylase UbiE